MLVAKQVADLITLGRAMLAFYMAWLGVYQGEQALPWVAWLMIASWTSDAVDGPIARRSRVQYQSWVGDHDLQIDMLVSIGLLFYLLISGFVELPWVGIYFLLWILVFWRWGLLRSLGLLFQAPIYGCLIWVAMRDVPTVGIWLIVWILGVVVITWPRFPREVIPGFLGGMRAIGQQDWEK